MTRIAAAVSELRVLRPDARVRRLNELIGRPTQHATELHWRAMLVTALREAGLWRYEATSL